eukprot:CFRG4674T1
MPSQCYVASLDKVVTNRVKKLSFVRNAKAGSGHETEFDDNVRLSVRTITKKQTASDQSWLSPIGSSDMPEKEDQGGGVAFNHARTRARVITHGNIHRHKQSHYFHTENGNSIDDLVPHTKSVGVNSVCIAPATGTQPVVLDRSVEKSSTLKSHSSVDSTIPTFPTALPSHHDNNSSDGILDGLNSVLHDISSSPAHESPTLSRCSSCTSVPHYRPVTNNRIHVAAHCSPELASVPALTPKFTPKFEGELAPKPVTREDITNKLLSLLQRQNIIEREHSALANDIKSGKLMLLEANLHDQLNFCKSQKALNIACVCMSTDETKQNGDRGYVEQACYFGSHNVRQTDLVSCMRSGPLETLQDVVPRTDLSSLPGEARAERLLVNVQKMRARHHLVTNEHVMDEDAITESSSSDVDTDVDVAMVDNTDEHKRREHVMPVTNMCRHRSRDSRFFKRRAARAWRGSWVEMRVAQLISQINNLDKYRINNREARRIEIFKYRQLQQSPWHSQQYNESIQLQYLSHSQNTYPRPPYQNYQSHTPASSQNHLYSRNIYNSTEPKRETLSGSPKAPINVDHWQKDELSTSHEAYEQTEQTNMCARLREYPVPVHRRLYSDPIVNLKGRPDLMSNLMGRDSLSRRLSAYDSSYHPILSRVSEASPFLRSGGLYPPPAVPVSASTLAEDDGQGIADKDHCSTAKRNDQAKDAANRTSLSAGTSAVTGLKKRSSSGTLNSAKQSKDRENEKVNRKRSDTTRRKDLTGKNVIKRRKVNRSGSHGDDVRKRSQSLSNVNDDITDGAETAATKNPRRTNSHPNIIKRKVFDIDNVVIPSNAAMVTRVQHIEFKEIETPSWRSVTDAISSDLPLESTNFVSVVEDEECSSEDTSDEAYQTRHAAGQVIEKSHFEAFMNHLHQPRRRRSSNNRKDPNSETMSGQHTNLSALDSANESTAYSTETTLGEVNTEQLEEGKESCIVRLALQPENRGKPATDMNINSPTTSAEILRLNTSERNETCGRKSITCVRDAKEGSSTSCQASTFPSEQKRARLCWSPRKFLR